MIFSLFFDLQSFSIFLYSNFLVLAFYSNFLVKPKTIVWIDRKYQYIWTKYFIQMCPMYRMEYKHSLVQI